MGTREDEKDREKRKAFRDVIYEEMSHVSFCSIAVSPPQVGSEGTEPDDVRYWEYTPDEECQDSQSRVSTDKTP